MPKVSICIPAYNQAAVLRKTLDSIITQTYQDYEVIITDDSPGNEVENLISDFDFQGRLKYFHNEIPLGSPENWNFCISKAEGDYIKIMHHDDWFTYSYSLNEYVKLLDDNAGVSFAFSGSVVLLENADTWVHSITNEQFAKIQDNPASLFTGNKIGAPSAVIFRKKNNILFDSNLKWLVDIAFYIQTLSEGNKCSYTQVPLVTTFEVKGRVSDECANDRQIEIYEHFYLLEEIATSNAKLTFDCLMECYNQAINICAKYNVTSVAEIRACGFNGTIPLYIRKQLFLKRRFLALKKIVKKLLLR